MPKKLCTAMLVGLLLAGTVEARDSRHMLSIEQALATADARAKLDGDIQFLFGRDANGEVVTLK